MTSELIIPQRAAPPTPGEVAAYLRAAGWTAGAVSDRWAEYRRTLADGDVTLEVPQRVQASDYARVLARVLDYIADLEARSVALVHQDVRSTSIDRVRLRLDGPGIVAGRLSVEAGWQVYEAARDLMLAGACAARRTAAAFPRRKALESMAVLNHARFGLAEAGSFVLNIESEVGGVFQSALVDDGTDPDAPLERKTAVMLARALQAAQGASREALARGSLASFKAHVVDGVSANLCEALADMITASDASLLDTSVAFASRRPVAADVPRSATFNAEARDVLRDAAKDLRQEARYVGIDVTGLVRRLDSGEVDHGGSVVLQASVDGRARPVQLELPAPDYQIAVDAHRRGVMVECTGDLERSGRSWVLLRPREFRTVEDPEDV